MTQPVWDNLDIKYNPGPKYNYLFEVVVSQDLTLNRLIWRLFELIRNCFKFIVRFRSDRPLIRHLAWRGKGRDEA